ncbi:hypothetical protein Poly59_46420 [Rubripirellula reticaptiva]|uniref:Uncharacterized protein n=1 Tax=Rubripirellula reticaptiva TaxID=2528013 RepID=A0A5C6EGY3_9BACT|nr:hypothetical protein Poly59_46420 [Rubripirellula reticaptiva]
MLMHGLWLADPCGLASGQAERSFRGFDLGNSVWLAKRLQSHSSNEQTESMASMSMEFKSDTLRLLAAHADYLLVVGLCSADKSTPSGVMYWSISAGSATTPAFGSEHPVIDANMTTNRAFSNTNFFTFKLLAG